MSTLLAIGVGALIGGLMFAAMLLGAMLGERGHR